MTEVWESIPPLPDPNGGKIAASASRIGDIIYIIGGYHVASNGSETSSAKVHRYQVSTNTYLTDGADIPIPIDDQVQAVWRDSLIYVVTGWSDITNVPDVQIYNPAEDSWSSGTPVPNNGFYKAFGAGGAIIGDTIYYFGGAALGSNFPGQYRLRRGIINPDNPTEVTWTVSGIFGIANKGYRMAAFEHNGLIHFLGGSDVTYNYNGIAYNGSGGVPPVNRNLFFNPSENTWDTNFDYDYPMDLRGIADLGAQIKYLAGGMKDNQQVTNKVYRLDWEELLPTSVESFPEGELRFRVYPNPTTSHIILELDVQTNKRLTVSLSSVFSKKIKEFEVASNSLNPVDISGLNPGIYVLSIPFNDRIYSKKIVII